MSRNMTHVVLVHTDAAPTDSEWQAYLDDMERLQSAPRRG